jgi:hypothetical protein
VNKAIGYVSTFTGFLDIMSETVSVKHVTIYTFSVIALNLSDSRHSNGII